MEHSKPEVTLIPTVRRAKLRHGRCYPIGAEALTSGLASVPQLSEFSVEFVCRRWWDGKVAVVYSSQEGSWQITIGSVPVKHRTVIREALLSLGLPALVKWLSARRTDVWFGRDHKFALSCWGNAANLSVSEFEKPRGQPALAGQSCESS